MHPNVSLIHRVAGLIWLDAAIVVAAVLSVDEAYFSGPDGHGRGEQHAARHTRTACDACATGGAGPARNAGAACDAGSASGRTPYFCRFESAIAERPFAKGISLYSISAESFGHCETSI